MRSFLTKPPRSTRPEKRLRILGIDPGTSITGYGVVDEGPRGLSASVYGCVTTPSGMTLPDRLKTIYADLSDIVDQQRPDGVAVEQIFFSKNVQTAFSVGQARGVILLLAAQRGIPVAEYTPPQVKLAIVGFGAATKEQMQIMVQRLLALSSLPTPDDAADALAIAICHLRGEPLRHAVQRAKAAR
jgi:crossover junction endodeoxyribonuclease RuvC